MMSGKRVGLDRDKQRELGGEGEKETPKRSFIHTAAVHKIGIIFLPDLSYRCTDGIPVYACYVGAGKARCQYLPHDTTIYGEASLDRSNINIMLPAPPAASPAAPAVHTIEPEEKQHIWARPPP